MEATVVKLYEYLNKDKIVKVPVYQRNYSWDIENCTQFFNDIYSIGEKIEIPFHFIGSIITIIEGSHDMDIHTIIDGQQRITTSIIFLKAFYDMTNNDYLKDEFIKRQIFKFTKDGKIAKLRLNKDDNDILDRILENQNLNEREKKSKLYKNYIYFKNIINSKNEDILHSGFEKLRIVGITLNQNENPQLIFESLNSTGAKLTSSDLIRNFLLMNKESNEQDRLYLKYWYEIEQLVTNEHIEEFFKSYLTIKQLKVVPIHKIYDSFKEYFSKDSLDSEIILKDSLFYARLYAKLIFTELESDSDIKLRIIRLENLNQKVIYPFLLECYANYEKKIMQKSEFIELLDFMENYIIRLVVCDIPSKGLNKFNTTLIKYLNESNQKLKTIQQLLLSSKSKNQRFISNKEFIMALKFNRIYQNSTLKGGKILLNRIESFLTKERVDSINLTIEHIMPQKLSKEWIKDLGENYKEIHSEYQHTLGNLTLSAYNSELGNLPFKDKKENFKESNLTLNRYFENFSEWNQENIEKRADILIDLILKIWSEPAELKELADNDIVNFTLNDRLELDPTNKIPISFEIFDREYKISSWRDLYINVIKLIYSKNQDSFERQIELNSFNKSKKLLAKSGKNFISYMEIENSFYLNTNLSAMQILSNLSTVFELLQINEDELTINLKG